MELPTLTANVTIHTHKGWFMVSRILAYLLERTIEKGIGEITLETVDT
jgi:hypothetical protein